ncbi:hypothetical protein ONZ45_g1450 [Pleurotus djamor]|nr:hypothetical protein ONZ45_g1450 [Pleurotus djamor]
MSDPDSSWHKITVRVPFASPKHALIAKQTIEVDAELQPHAVKRHLDIDGDVLVALARLTVNSFLENVDLVVRTIGEFGEDAEHGTSKLSIDSTAPS